MRALCVQNPWASLIAEGVKTLEVRSWSTKYRGPIVIVASRAWSRHCAAERWERTHFDAPRGVTMCVVDLVDVRTGVASDARHTGGVDPTGQLVWKFENVRPVAHRPVKGQLGLFTL